MIGNEYRTIERFPHYRFGSDGSVWRCRNNRFVETHVWVVVKSRLDRYGYLHCHIRPNRHSKQLDIGVHRLICEAFHGPCPSGLECAHWNGTKTDNRPSNLRWDTRTGNQKDKDRHGTKVFGERVGTARLCTSDVRLLRKLLGLGLSISDARKLFGVATGTVVNVKHRKYWKHVSDQEDAA